MRFASQLTGQTARPQSLSRPVREATGGGQNLSYFYDQAGQMTSQVDAALNKTTSFVYDAAGQHVQETTTQAGVAYQDNHLKYDDRGRLVDSSDGSVHVTYAYDAAGNRSHVNIQLSKLDPTSGTVAISKDQWFAYDGMNRETHVNWDQSNAAGADGHTLTYDADGNRLTDAFTGNLVNRNIIALTWTATLGAVTERYTYDADDRMLLGTVNMTSGAAATPTQVQIENRLYDSGGRLVQQGAVQSANFLTAANSTINGMPGLQLTSLQQKVYDDRGELVSVSGQTIQATTGADQTANFTTVYAYDAAGNTTSTSLTSDSFDTNGNRTDFSDVTTFTHVASEAYEVTTKSSVETTKVLVVAANNTTTTITYPVTTTAFDQDGAIKSVTDTTGNHSYVSDLGGHVLFNGYPGQEMRSLVVDGQEVGQYELSVGSVDPTHDDFNFGFGFDSLESDDETSSTTTIEVQDDESLGQLAAAAYGDSQLWQRIAIANGLSGNARLQRGERVLLPGVTGQPSNSLGTHAVDMKSRMVGRTSPVVNPAIVPVTPQQLGGMFDRDYDDLGILVPPGPKDRDPAHTLFSELKVFPLPNVSLGDPQNPWDPYGSKDGGDVAVNEALNELDAVDELDEPNVQQQTFRSGEIQDQDDQEAADAQNDRENNRLTMGTALNAGRVVTIGSGGSLSGAIGSSAPQTLGNTMAANGMTSSLVFPGENIFVPSDPTLYGNQVALGQGTLNVDNESHWLSEQTTRERSREQFLADANSQGSVSASDVIAMTALALQKPAALGDPGVCYDPAYLARFTSGPQLTPYDAQAAAAQAAQQQRDANTLGMWGGGLLAVGAFAGRAMHVDENSVSDLGIASAGLLIGYEGMPPIDSATLSPVPVVGNTSASQILTSGQVEGLKAIGLSDAQMSELVNTTGGDLWVFRGSRADAAVAGGESSQIAGYTPVTIDPLKATIFGLGREGIDGTPASVFFGPSKGLDVELGIGNVPMGADTTPLVQLERELGASVTPDVFAQRAPYSISARDSLNILNDMGLNVQSQVTGDLSDVLRSYPAMTPQQVQQYIQQATKLNSKVGG